MTGPVTVKGEQWNTGVQMPPIGADLPDADLSYVLTYIRHAWGNNAVLGTPDQILVTPEQIKTVRDQVSGRAEPWTADELLKISEGE
jgi:hypothetical protein